MTSMTMGCILYIHYYAADYMRALVLHFRKAQKTDINCGSRENAIVFDPRIPSTNESFFMLRKYYYIFVLVIITRARRGKYTAAHVGI